MIKVIATVDRIEGEKAVLLLPVEKGEVSVAWPVELLPSGAREGSKLIISLQEDPEREREARQRVAGLLDKLTARKSE